MKIPNKFNGYSKDGIRLYNDPMTMAVVGGMAGAALSPKDPLKGALLGAVGGYGGGALLSTMGTGAAASGASAANIAAQPALSYAGTQAGTAAAAPTGFLGNTMAGIGKDFSAVNAFTKEYPVASGMAAGLAKDALFQQQKPLDKGPGLLHGQMAPMAQQDQPYQFSAPKISLI
jgi:hypothetical protein